MLIGLFLVLIGVIWLLSTLGYLTMTIGQVIWPIIIIALGLSILLKKGQCKDWCCFPEKEEKK